MSARTAEEITSTVRAAIPTVLLVNVVIKRRLRCSPCLSHGDRRSHGERTFAGVAAMPSGDVMRAGKGEHHDPGGSRRLTGRT